jgi:NADH-quinone oxidoreductase subunit M
MWRALTKAFFGEATPGAVEHTLPPITFPEKRGALLLIASTLVVGLYPRILTDLILPSLNSPLFEGLRRGAWR